MKPHSRIESPIPQQANGNGIEKNTTQLPEDISLEEAILTVKTYRFTAQQMGINPEKRKEFETILENLYAKNYSDPRQAIEEALNIFNSER